MSDRARILIVDDEEVVRDALAALSRARDQGWNQTEVFDQRMRARAFARLELEEGALNRVSALVRALKPWCAGTWRKALPRRMPRVISISWRSLSAPGRSALLTTNTSAISMIPAFMAWMSSPIPGTRTTTETSAVLTISTSS